MGNLFFALRGKEGQNVLFAPAVSQIPLIQNNNHYARVARYRVAYSEETRPFGGSCTTENIENYRTLLSSLIYCEKYLHLKCQLG